MPRNACSHSKLSKRSWIWRAWEEVEWKSGEIEDSRRVRVEE